jgi:regulator of nucleoside diphosphate kinase
MRQTKNELVLRKDDYNMLISFLHGTKPNLAFDQLNAEALRAELRKATLVDSDKFPGDVVRINSKVLVKTGKKNKVMQFVLVTPDESNIKENKISVMAPLGTALLGFRKGQRVKWRVPAGEKTFEIVDVINTD